MILKIFVTGVAGFLGSHIASKMIDLGHKVVGVDNLIGGYIENIPNEVDFHQIDCKHINSISKIMKDCDIVYHTACTAYEGLSVFAPNFVVQNTLQITTSILSASIQNKVKRFIYCSSMARYGEQEEVPFHEEMQCNPIDPYGIAKYSAELMVKNLSQIHGMEYVIAVPHNIIGPRQKYDDPFRNVASIMINLMLQGRQPIIYGDGNQKRCFSFIDDIIYCLEKLAFQDNVVGEVINIGPDEEFVTINELAIIIADIIGFELNPIYVDDRPQEIKLAKCSSNKARSLLKYETHTSLRDGLIQMVKYIKNKGTKKFRYHIELEILNSKTPKTWSDKLF